MLTLSRVIVDLLIAIWRVGRFCRSRMSLPSLRRVALTFCVAGEDDPAEADDCARTASCKRAFKGADRQSRRKTQDQVSAFCLERWGRALTAISGWWTSAFAGGGHLMLTVVIAASPPRGVPFSRPAFGERTAPALLPRLACVTPDSVSSPRSAATDAASLALFLWAGPSALARAAAPSPADFASRFRDGRIAALWQSARVAETSAPAARRRRLRR